MREKIQRFMIGRYGADELAKAQSIAALVLLFLSMFSRLGIFYWLAIALMIYSTWRMFSKNISARYAENQKYLNYRYQMAVKWDRFKKHLAQRKNYRFYKCPQCKQKVRVPKKVENKRRFFHCLVISISIKKNYRKKVKKYIRHITADSARNSKQIVAQKDRCC